MSTITLISYKLIMQPSRDMRSYEAVYISILFKRLRNECGMISHVDYHIVYDITCFTQNSDCNTTIDNCVTKIASHNHTTVFVTDTI